MPKTSTPSTLRRLLPVGVAFLLFFGSSAALGAVEDGSAEAEPGSEIADPPAEYAFVVPDVSLGDTIVYDEFYAYGPYADESEGDPQDPEGGSNATEPGDDLVSIGNISVAWS